ncbi:MAG: helix-turn-helix transcriptional regulator [Xanthomonadales bacterium]|nr:helix-turn-helix transcriptional regulator [Xanthomonadales bacterium]
MLTEEIGSYPIQAGIESAVGEILRSDGTCRIETLAQVAGQSVRQFQVRFLEIAGLTAKEFSRVIRLQAVLRQLDQQDNALADLALQTGFSGQSHANRELRRMTGLTPAKLRLALQSAPNNEQTIRLAAAFVRGRSS